MTQNNPADKNENNNVTVQNVTVQNVIVEETVINETVIIENGKRGKKPKNPVIQNDVMRYKKNKAASSLALTGLALGCLYFLVLYSQVKNNNFYYTWEIAFDVIYNLFFLLFVFLFSEQVKNYNRKLFPLQVAVGALQIARIFWLPFKGILNSAVAAGDFVAMTVFLAASGACIIASAAIGFIRAKSVENFSAKLERGEIDLDGELRKEEGDD